METSVNSLVGIRASLPRKVMGPLAQLICIYPNTHSMGNKQGKLEAIVQQDNYIVAVTEMRWDNSHGWSSVVDG